MTAVRLAAAAPAPPGAGQLLLRAAEPLGKRASARNRRDGTDGGQTHRVLEQMQR